MSPGSSSCPGCSCPAGAVEAAPALPDREIVERLARLEEGQGGLRADMQQLREDMNRQNELLRTNMTEPFARQFHLTLALLAALSALVTAIPGFVLWDRRTMLRPFERSIRSLEEDIGSHRRRLDALVEALRALGQHKPRSGARSGARSGGRPPPVSLALNLFFKCGPPLTREGCFDTQPPGG